jgi:hypothetical protein
MKYGWNQQFPALHATYPPPIHLILNDLDSPKSHTFRTVTRIEKDREKG